MDEAQEDDVIPLYGFLEGDTIGLLVLADEQDTAATLADKLQTSAQVRVRPYGTVQVLYDGRLLEPQLTVTDALFEPLDRFDVVVAPNS